MQQRHRAILLHLAGRDVQERFTTSTGTGECYRLRASAFRALNAYFCATAKLSIRPPDLLLDHAKPRWNCSTVHHLLKEISLRLWFCHCHIDNLVRDAHLNKWLSLTSNENCLKKAKDWTNNTYPTDCHAVRKDRNPTGCTFSRRRRIRKYPLSEVTIRALAHKGDSKGEIRYVTDLVWLDI